jgi:hypothetical protein
MTKEELLSRYKQSKKQPDLKELRERRKRIQEDMEDKRIMSDFDFEWRFK